MVKGSSRIARTHLHWAACSPESLWVAGSPNRLPPSPAPVRLKPGLPLLVPAAGAPERSRERQQRRLHVEAMPLGKRAGSNHDGVLAPIATEPQALAQALHHRQMRLTPRVIFRSRMPVHAGQLAAVRAGEKATRDGGSQRRPTLDFGHGREGGHRSAGPARCDRPRKESHAKSVLEVQHVRGRRREGWVDTHSRAVLKVRRHRLRGRRQRAAVMVTTLADGPPPRNPHKRRR